MFPRGLDQIIEQPPLGTAPMIIDLCVALWTTSRRRRPSCAAPFYFCKTKIQVGALSETFLFNYGS